MRLIDADALAGRILMEAPGFMDGGSEITKAFILAMIKTRSVTPTVDGIPVVRCKDCRHRYVDGDNVRYNMCLLNHNKVQSDDWFCADGKRSVIRK